MPNEIMLGDDSVLMKDLFSDWDSDLEYSSDGEDLDNETKCNESNILKGLEITYSENSTFKEDIICLKNYVKSHNSALLNKAQILNLGVSQDATYFHDWNNEFLVKKTFEYILLRMEAISATEAMKEVRGDNLECIIMKLQAERLIHKVRQALINKNGYF